MMLILTSLMAASGLTGIALGLRMLRLFKRFTRTSLPPLPDSMDALPTVSVCIPARNETHAMTQCLERVIASTYPKLEIIVLDDSSVDNTSILIKSFAHAGVRFVEGSPLPDGWIGKAHAQQGLFREASGDFLLFLDVDTLLAPHSIDALVTIALTEQSTVLSVLPVRDDLWRGSVLFATLRYFWSVIAHTKQQPAASSGVWFVKKQLLHDSYGGFTALRMAVTPETVVATEASKRNEYRFLLSNATIGISYEKKWLSQCQTAIRLLYPFFGGQPVRAFLGLLFLALLLLPFVVTATAVIIGWSFTHNIALAAAVILLLVYVLYTARVWRSGWLIGGLLFPIILAQECILLLYSMYSYATKTVTWKGRPIQQSARDGASL